MRAYIGGKDYEDKNHIPYFVFAEAMNYQYFLVKFISSHTAQ